MTMMAWGLLWGSQTGTLHAFDAATDDYNLAVGLYKQSRWDLAEQKFQEYLKNHPRHAKVPFGRLYLGLTLVNLEEFDDARTVLRGFVKSYPTNKNVPDALYRVGECSYWLRDYKSAADELQRYLKQEPKGDLAEWALPYLARSLLKTDRAALAADSYRKAITQFPSGALIEDARFGLAETYEALDKTDDALPLYRKVAEDRTAALADRAQLRLATIEFDRENFLEAAREFLTLVERFPKSSLVGSARLNAGYAYFQAGDFAAAAVQFRSAAGDKTLAPTAHYWQAVSLKSQRKFEEARTAFEAAYKADGNGQLSEQILYQWASTELHGGDFPEARARFLEVVSRWPEGTYADDALHFAAEAALQQSEQLPRDKRGKLLDEVDALVARFSKEFPTSSLQMHERLLRGRAQLARGDQDHMKLAADLFLAVLEDSKRPATQDQARYHLAATLQKLGQHEHALKVVTPLATQARQQGATSEFADAMIIQGVSAYDQKDYRQSAAAMAAYLKLLPQGPRLAQALATSALCAAQTKDHTSCDAFLADLRRRAPQSPLAAQITHNVAEIAYENRDWSRALALFETLANAGTTSPYHADSLSGRAWCRFNLKQYKPAAKDFAEVAQTYADDKSLAPEAAYMHAQSLALDGQAAAAVTAYSQAFEKHAPSRMAYLSGLQAARTLANRDELDKANTAYERLLKTFPKPERLDQLLDEWAALNYEAEQFDKADEIFRRIIKETPDSKLVSSARLSLAESDLIAGRLESAEKTFLELRADRKVASNIREQSLLQLLQISLERKDWKQVVEHAGQIQRDFPQTDRKAYAAYRIGEAQLQLGDFQESRTVFEQILADRDDKSLSSSDWFPHVWLLEAEAAFRLKQYEAVASAVAGLHAHDSQSPFLPEARVLLGQSLYQQRKFSEALKVFRQALTNTKGARIFTPAAAEAQFRIAETYLIQKDYRNALLNYLEVHIRYKHPRWQAPALYQAGQCDESLKQWRNAAQSYKRLVSEFPDSEFAAKAKARLLEVEQQ